MSTPERATATQRESVVIREVSGLSALEFADVRALLRAVFPDIDLADYERRHNERVALLRVEGVLATHAAILDRGVEVGGTRVRVVGIGGIATATAYRGRGLARQVIDAIVVEARCPAGPDFALLNCPAPLVSYYTRLGWQEIHAPVYYDDGRNIAALAWPSMFLPLRDAVWPDGDVDMRGTRW